jgi:imidazolonepropionase-like amidohydrolase
MRLAVALVFVCATTAAAQPSADTLRYTVLTPSTGLRNGFMTVTRRGDTLVVHYEYADRGVGPSIDERIVLDTAGVPRDVDVSGSDRWKNRVHDRFHGDSTTASWENGAEHGRASAGGVYLPLDPTPADYAVLAVALAHAPAGRARLLPTGQATLRRVERREVVAGERRAGVTLYAIEGIRLHPVDLWLDDDGRFFFAGDAAYSATIRDGFESAVAELTRAQGDADTRWEREVAGRVARRLTRPVAIRHARLFVAESASVRPRTTVVVDGERIVTVGPDDAVKIPLGAEVIDAAGRTLLPGLWDMHAHLGGEDGLLDFAAGVTTARDMANDSTALRRLVEAYADGTRVGPRVLRAGLIDGPGPLTSPGAIVVSTPDEAVRAVDSYAARGYVQAKIYNSLAPELVPVVAREAHAKGMRVSGHVPAHMTAAAAVRAGFDEINHIAFLVLNFLGDTLSANTAAFSAAYAGNAALLDVSSDSVRALIALLKERHTVVDPTLNIFEHYLLARRGEVWPGYEALARRMPSQTRRGLLTGGFVVPAGMEARYRASFPATERLVKALYDAGVPIVAGTDGFTGFALQRELELYVDAGIPPARVLQLATLGAARVMGRDGESGSVAPGKLADLVLVDGDPAARIGDVRHASLVITRGRVYHPAELHAALGIRP